MSIEERLDRLESIEAIRYLQAKYQRCLDTRDFDGIADCMDLAVVSAYDNGSMAYEGRDAVIAFLRSVMTKHIPSSHLIHGGEIDILTPATAKAKWYLEDYLLHRRFLAKLHGAAIYDVEYLRSGDPSEEGTLGWRIAHIGYTRSYQYFELRGLVNLLTLSKTTFLDRMK